MRALVLGLLTACGGAKPAPPVEVAPPSAPSPIGATITTEDTTEGGGHEPILKAAGDRAHATLDRAAGAHGYEVHITLTTLDRTDKIACRISIQLMSRPQQEVLAVLDGGANAGGTDDVAASDCITTLIQDLLDTKVTPELRHLAGS